MQVLLLIKLSETTRLLMLACLFQLHTMRVIIASTTAIYLLTDSLNFSRFPSNAFDKADWATISSFLFCCV